jgi:hypothetical protein
LQLLTACYNSATPCNALYKWQRFGTKQKAKQTDNNTECQSSTGRHAVG